MYFVEYFCFPMKLKDKASPRRRRVVGCLASASLFAPQYGEELPGYSPFERPATALRRLRHLINARSTHCARSTLAQSWLHRGCVWHSQRHAQSGPAPVALPATATPTPTPTPTAPTAPTAAPAAPTTCSSMVHAATATLTTRSPLRVRTRRAAAVAAARSCSQAASQPYIDLNRAPYNAYGVKYIDLVSPAPFQATRSARGPSTSPATTA